MGKKRAWGGTEQALDMDPANTRRLLAMRTCSISQAAHAALVLGGHSIEENETAYMQAWMKIKNSAAKETRNVKQQLVESLCIAGQNIWITKLPEYLQQCCDSSPVFQKVLADSVVGRADPLNLLVYVDETTGGNPLNPVTGKKSWLIYVTVLEWNHFVKLEDFWLVASLIQHENVPKVPGGLSHIMKALLLHWHSGGILDPAGLSIDLNGQPTLVRFKVRGMVSDEAATKLVMQFKGASGLKPCGKCVNVISKFHSRMIDLASDDLFVDIAETDVSKFVRTSDANVQHIWQSLENVHYTASKEEAEKLEKLYGWNWCPEGVLAHALCRSILPASACHFDFLHVLFSNGIVSLEIALFWDQVSRLTTLTLSDLERWILSGFTFCKNHTLGNYALKKLVDPKLLEKGSYAGDGSQTVMTALLLEVFVQTVLLDLDGPLKIFAHCYLKLCELIRWYFRMKFGKCKDQANHSSFLIPLISRHLASFQECYGKNSVKPKHHFCFHAAEAFDVQQTVLDCWTAERKHRVYKDVSRKYQPDASFEPNVLVRLLVIQEHALSMMKKEPFLHKCKKQTDVPQVVGSKKVVAGKSARACGQSIFTGDIFLFDTVQSTAGQVTQCLLVDWGLQEELLLLVADMTLCHRHAADKWHLSEWLFNGRKSVVNFSRDHSHMLWPNFSWEKPDGKICVAC